MDVINPNIKQDGLNHQYVAEVYSRFDQVNKNRLLRMRLGLQAQQRVVLDLLPLLFQVNYHRLPGWIDGDVPLGIEGYRPEPNVLSLARNISPSFTYTAGPANKAPITGLYVMGSVGTIAQSTNSDLDLWLCHSGDLSPDDKYLLEQKTELISKWAAGFNMEVHFFLMDSEQFKLGETGRVTEESSGSTQHHLLLDEFYRTNVLLAGGFPLWWLVPSKQEADYEYYLEYISQNRLIPVGEGLDFGDLSQLPGGEFIGAGMWQLYKGIDSPYKSLLKLLLMESYANDFPEVRCLSLDFKQAIFDGSLDLDELDPYIMLYRRIERYLKKRGEFERLELVRKAFYFKVGLPLSRHMKNRSSSWRRTLMRKLVLEWNWTNDKIEELDDRTSWGFNQYIDERKTLVAELTTSYRFLSQIARQLPDDQLANPKDMVILGRRLSAAFDRKPGKIVMLNSSNVSDLSQEKLRFIQVPSTKGGRPVWTAQTGISVIQATAPRIKPLKSASSILEVVVWSFFNRLLDAHINVPFVKLANDIRTTLTDFELKSIISSLRQEWTNPPKKIPQSNFHRPSRPVQISLYVNVGLDPLPYLTAKGLQKLSSRNDSLDFSALRENLIQSLDMVLLTSWNEVLVYRFESGEDTMIQCLQFTLSQLAKGAEREIKLNVHCYSNTRPAAISRRVNDLFGSVIGKLLPGGKVNNGRYVLSIASQYHILQFREQALSVRVALDELELLEYLGEEQRYHSPIHVDEWALSEKPELKHILRNMFQPGVQLYYTLVGPGKARVYVVDELGSLWVYVTPFYNPATLLLPLYRFLRMVEYRQNSEQFLDEELSNQLNRKMRFYEYVPASTKKPAKLYSKTPDATAVSVEFFNVQAAVMRDSERQIQYSLQYRGQEFDTLTLGDSFYTEVASYLVSQRTSEARYPCYITELEIADDIKAQLPFGRAQTMHYFRYKQRLEFRINQAMNNL